MDASDLRRATLEACVQGLEEAVVVPTGCPSAPLVAADCVRPAADEALAAFRRVASRRRLP